MPGSGPLLSGGDRRPAPPRADLALQSGRGAVTLVRSGARTVIHTARAASPLRLLTPGNRGPGAWIYLASLGGGLVDGDAVRLDVALGPGACGLLGTQASTKVYRCPTGTCRQEIRAKVAAEGLLVSIPDPVACFAGARYDQSVTVDLAEGASLVLLDTLTSGRSARGERWDFLRYASRTAVVRAGRTEVLDAVVLDPAHGDLPSRLGRFEALATLVLSGPRLSHLASMALVETAPVARAALLLRSASPLPFGEGAVIRFAGTSVEAVTLAVRGALAGLAELLGDDPWARKW